MNEDFIRGILHKIGFKPQKMKRAQAFLLYAALTGETFTADCLPDEMRTDNTTAGCAVRALEILGLIECCGRRRSTAKSRHGAEVRMWRLVEEKRSTARAWLEKNQFPFEQTDSVPALTA
jgi:hypothetical protein